MTRHLRTVVLAVIASLVMSGGVAMAGSPQCPRKAVMASYDLWPVGAVARSTMRSGKHPCGRQIECRGGVFGGRGRFCRWA